MTKGKKIVHLASFKPILVCLWVVCGVLGIRYKKAISSLGIENKIIVKAVYPDF